MGESAAPRPADAVTVSELVSMAREVLEDNFHRVQVKGEISRLLRHGSGHMYFQLKDRDAAISAVMFRNDNRRLRFRPEDGLDVLATGRISLYEARGQFQLIVSDMEPLGVGSLYLALEQLKKRLQGEGLFDEERKQSLPMLPARIGIATSPTGAAIRDMLQVLGRRFAEVEVLIAPCRVQGAEAAPEIVAALERLDRAGVDLILLGRGGGSLEDLWAFNEESVARAVAACRTPVITGIGHEIDITVADLVADRRAPTPSAAAEIAVQDRVEIARRLGALHQRLRGSIRLGLSRNREQVRGMLEHPAMRRVTRRLEALQQSHDDLTLRTRLALERGLRERSQRVRLLRERLHPLSLRQQVRNRRERLLQTRERLESASRARIREGRGEIRRLAEVLGSISPLAVLARGYAICQDATEGVVRSHRDVAAGETVRVRLHRGTLDCEVQRSMPPPMEEE